MAIKSTGRHYTISLLVNYTGNLELRSFYYSMLHPNNACRKHLILSFYQRYKKSSIRRQWSPVKICRSCKKLTNYEHPALSKTKTNRSCFRSSLALCILLLPWKTHRIHGPNLFKSNDKK